MHDEKVLCDIARSMADDVWMNVAYAVQVMLCSAMTAIVLYIVASGKITRTIAHDNVKVCRSSNELIMKRPGICLDVCLETGASHFWSTSVLGPS